VRRLIINMPPLAEIDCGLPAFVLGHDPSRRTICVSYSGDLAKKHANDFRAVLESPWYRSAFPSTRIGPFKNSETEIALTAREDLETLAKGLLEHETLTGDKPQHAV
jgi:hypothetical protein